METIVAEKPTVKPTGCCPPFDPATWDRREVVWRDHPFVHEHVRSFFHVPLDIGKKITHALSSINAAGAAPPQGLMLADDSSLFGSELYIDVTKPVPGAEMTYLSGRFLAKVYDGPFRDARRWMADMQRYVQDRGEKLDRLYLAYTTCPSCAKAYGHNYVVVFAKVGDAPS